MADVNLVRDVLDKILRDRNGRECGRVDGVILRLRQGKPPVVSEIEIGIFTVLRRVNRRLGEWLGSIAPRVIPIPIESVTLPLDKFTHEGNSIELPIDAEKDRRLMRAEKWLRSNVVDRIPGGRSPK